MQAPPSPDGREVVAPAGRAAWRDWLRARPDRSEGTWVAVPKQKAQLPEPTYDDLVEEALCFGWIDGQAAKGDDARMLLWFSPRRKGSVWARSNKERVDRLISAGVMTERGMAVIRAAKADGSWSQYDDVDALVVHGDLDEALSRAPAAKDAFDALPPSHKKQHLWYVYQAKRPETRARRISETIRRLQA